MSEYRTTAADRSNRITALTIARINGIDPTQQERVKQKLRDLQRQQIDEINQLLGSFGITDKAYSIDDVNNLFSGLKLSGGRKSTRRKTRKSRKSRRRR
jgi:hypothetical protein